MSMAFDKEKLRRALSDEAGFSGSVYETYLELKKKFEVEEYPANVYLINVNGRVCQVTVPADVSIQEAIKSIQEAEDAEREPFDTSLLAGLNEHSQPAPKPKQNHNWYKFNNKKYGRR